MGETDIEGETRLARCGDAVAYFRPMFAGAASETLRVLHLDGQGRMIGASAYPGDHEKVDFPLRLIVEDALRFGAESLVIAHNHPSGDTTPSHADLAVTRTLADLVRQLDITLIDHLIFADNGWRSLRAMGIL